jgi:hypothetical protein
VDTPQISGNVTGAVVVPDVRDPASNINYMKNIKL